MPSVVDDDLDTIIDLPGSAHKPLTKAKLDQLASAREKAMLVRRRTQKAGLESRLHQVKLLLGELDPMHIEKVQQAMMNQERELRAKQNELTNSLKSLLNDEAIKRASEYDSLKRSMLRIANDLQEIKQSLGVRETNRSTSRANSTVSSVAPTTTKIPLSALSSTNR